MYLLPTRGSAVVASTELSCWAKLLLFPLALVLCLLHNSSVFILLFLPKCSRQPAEPPPWFRFIYTMTLYVQSLPRLMELAFQHHFRDTRCPRSPLALQWMPFIEMTELHVLPWNAFLHSVCAFYLIVCLLLLDTSTNNNLVWANDRAKTVASFWHFKVWSRHRRRIRIRNWFIDWK